MPTTNASEQSGLGHVALAAQSLRRAASCFATRRAARVLTAMAETLEAFIIELETEDK